MQRVQLLRRSSPSASFPDRPIADSVPLAPLSLRALRPAVLLLWLKAGPFHSAATIRKWPDKNLALYGVSFNPNACYGPAPFAPVHYSRWPYREPGTLYVVRYTKPANP